MKAIILAGGESRRFGRPKAFAEVEGQMFYQRIIKVLESTNMFNDILISTNNQLKINLTIRTWSWIPRSIKERPISRYIYSYATVSR